MNFYIHSQLLDFIALDKTYLLADRLIEYLTGNVITNISREYDIEKLQRAVIALNTKIIVNGENTNKYYTGYNTRYLGIWDDNLLNALKWIIIIESEKEGSELSEKYDILGYCDKNVEEVLNRIITTTTDTDGKALYNIKGEII